jgi:dienelactone hydrolase
VRAARPRAGRSVTAVLYPDAHHHFDGAEPRRRTTVPEARGGLGAIMEYNPRAHEDAEKQVRAFLRENLAR